MLRFGFKNHGLFCNNPEYFLLQSRVFKLVQCGKQFDSIIRQIAERITEVAVRHSKFVCFDGSSGKSFEDLIEAIGTDDCGSGAANDDMKRLEPGLEEWGVFMDDIWRTFCTTCPAGLARQMYTRIVVESLVHVVHIAANLTKSGDNEIENGRCGFFDQYSLTSKFSHSTYHISIVIIYKTRKLASCNVCLAPLISLVCFF